MIDAGVFCFFGFIVFLIWLTAALVKKTSVSKMIFVGCCIVYGVMVLAVTLCPIPYRRGGMTAPIEHNFVFFRSISRILSNGMTRTAAVQIFGNIIMAVPYGVAVKIIKPKSSVFLYALSALAFPIAVESLQAAAGLLIGAQYRTVDVDDVLLNALGACAGYVVYFSAPKKIKLYFDLSGQK